DAVLTFVSVFAAVLLAFYVEGLRERRATEERVRDHLRSWRTALEASVGDRVAHRERLERIDDALGRWLDLGSSGVEPAWADLGSVSVGSVVSLNPLLLSGGASAVPADLMQQMLIADAGSESLLRRGENLSRLFDHHVLPLVLAQVTWLSPEQRNAVERYRTELADLSDHVNVHLDQLDRIRERLDGAGS
ncbi:MAG: hypothetical protein ACJ72D_28400, partial [Marmoricola sp.]